MNVLENAVDTGRDHANESHPQIVFRVYPDGQDVVFEIKDNGIGMSAEVQSKIFTLFFSSKSTQGTGIGLFITQKIIHQHGGQITVASQPGEGTLFRIAIPID